MILQIFWAWVSDKAPPNTAKIVRPVLLEHADFFKGATVHQQLDTFTGCQFAFFVLLFNPVLAAAEQCFLFML
jgi:hypothetical protein